MRFLSSAFASSFASSTASSLAFRVDSVMRSQSERTDARPPVKIEKSVRRRMKFPYLLALLTACWNPAEALFVLSLDFSFRRSS